MRKPEALAVEVHGRGLREFLRPRAGEFKTTLERRCLGRRSANEFFSLRWRKKYGRFGLIIVRESLEAPRRRISDVPEAVRTIQTSNHSTDEPIDRPG